MVSTESGEVEATFHLFPLLPCELRRKIWQSTLEPQTLTLSLHLKKNFTTYHYPGRPNRNTYNLYTTIASFTARKGIHPHPEKKSDSGSQSSRPGVPLCSTISFRGLPFLNERQREKSLPGPVILEVCRESREIGLERYERAFGGVDVVREMGKGRGEKSDEEFHKEFEKSGVSVPKIWVDFQSDTVVFVGADGDGGAFTPEEGGWVNWEGDLEEYVRYARGEVAKMKKIAMAGVWVGEVEGEIEDDEEEGDENEIEWVNTRCGGELSRVLGKSLREFESLQLLRLYPTYWHRIVKAPAMPGRSADYGLRKSPEFEGWSYGDRNGESMRLRILEYLKKKRMSQGDEWMTELPIVEVSRDVQWMMEGRLPLLAFDDSPTKVYAHESHGTRAYEDASIQ